MRRKLVIGKNTLILVRGLKTDNPGAPAYEVNYGTIIAVRKIGKGFTGLSNFSGFINLPPPINIKSFRRKRNQFVVTLPMPLWNMLQMNLLKNKEAEILLKTKLLVLLFPMMEAGKTLLIAKQCSYCNSQWLWEVCWQKLAMLTKTCVVTKSCNACTSWEKRKNNEPELY